ncbi:MULTISPECIES: nitroreductase family protein [Streptomyces]|uniref:nitroreductase family protein n=1 Tax=Streptomyces TaxID=1883 RepID=UPI00167AAC9C|nr:MULTISPECIES: nitroreductase family protein [Streptomyces]MBK3524606.1 nitroreductase family protein [Streptomyces sp. MBT70]GGR98800.1 oxidoreductase [Streptomyces eurythermus]
MTLALSSDQLLSTTRAVRHRLDLTRPVPRRLLEECVDLAVQAPSGRNRQRWHFVIVTDPERRAALADVWRAGVTAPGASEPLPERDVRRASVARMDRVYSGTAHLYAHLHEVPALVVPCVEGRTDHAPVLRQAGTWGSILPAVWSFMLAARARGLGTCWTTGNLVDERESARVLGIPYDDVMQAALIPVAYTLGTDFRPAPRIARDRVLHWDQF